MVKQIAMITGTVLGAAAIVGGVGAQWNRIAPKLSVPEQSVVVQTPSVGELLKQQTARKSAELQGILDGFAAKYPGQFGIVVTDLTTGATASIAAHDQMVSASIYKLYVGWGVYKKIDAGTLTINSKLKNGQTVAQCMEAMITVSDNDCGYALGALVGWKQLDADLASLGLTKTSIDNYGRNIYDLVDDKYTSAADIALFTEALYRGKLLSPASTSAYLSTLKADKLNTWLPSGLPKGTVIAHKTGALYDLVHDAGVVYAQNGDYLIVVMSRNWQNAVKQSPAAFADISRQIWEYETR